MNFPESIFSYISTEESTYQTEDIEVFDNFSWNMKKHIQMSTAFKHSKFVSATNEFRVKNPFKNVVLSPLRLRYRAEDIDVKDIHLYIEDPAKHHISFLIKKYHDDVFVLENDLDTFFDKAKEEKIDLGGVLVKKGEGALPEVMHLQSIAFCDQTDILSGPIGLKFNFSPDALRKKAKLGWGDSKNGADITIEALIREAKLDKDAATTNETRANRTTGKNIEVYIVRGEMPQSYLKDNGDPEKMVNQLQIVAFFESSEGSQGTKKNKTLFKAEEKEQVYKFHNTEQIFGRALGFGGVEELFDAQMWTNSAEINKSGMLRSASKIILQTPDDNYANRNKIKNMENLQVTVAKEGGITQVPTGSPNIQLFNEYIGDWNNHAKELSGATDPLLGKQPPSGTPFRLQERVVFEGKGLHEYRQGKFAKFIEEIYRDWIIPHIMRKITKGVKFLSTLSFEEMNFLSDKISSNKAAKSQIEDILNGRQPQDFQVLKQKFSEDFIQGGNERFLEIIKDELKGAELKVKINIAGKQADLVEMANKLSAVVRQFLATPQLREDPIAFQKVKELIEISGIKPTGFGGITSTPPATAAATQPIKELTRQPTLNAPA